VPINILKNTKARMVFVGVAIAAIGGGIFEARLNTPEDRSADALFSGKRLNTEINCLALNIYFEARSEPKRGQIAVAKVTVNRMKHPKFPSTICSVVTQRTGTPQKTCQFSWWCDGKSDRPTEQDAWNAATKLAAVVIAGGHADPSKGALFYHHQSIRPAWSAQKRFRTKIGSHMFYK
jgi:N-acetylmuramoyl-L-alanine amidase